MNKYLISETPNLNPPRPAVHIEAKSLAQAKRKASMMQYFRGSTIKVSDDYGTLICYKEFGKSWIEVKMTLKQLCTRHGYRDIKNAARLIGRTPRTLLNWLKDPNKRENVLEPLLKAHSPLDKDDGNTMGTRYLGEAVMALQRLVATDNPGGRDLGTKNLFLIDEVIDRLKIYINENAKQGKDDNAPELFLGTHEALDNLTIKEDR